MAVAEGKSFRAKDGIRRALTAHVGRDEPLLASTLRAWH
jgi:hypothetical protein